MPLKGGESFGDRIDYAARDGASSVALTFVPLGGITVSHADESALYHHYELNSTPTHTRERTPTHPPLTRQRQSVAVRADGVVGFGSARG
jgi:hypothetical protein